MGARKSLYTPELADEIIERISNGTPLAQICRDEHMPGLTTVYDWMRKDPALAERFARAREAGHDMIANDALRIADETPPPTEKGGTDAGFVQWQKNRIWTRLQLLAKWDPKRYGEKAEVEHKGNVGLTVNVVRLTDAGD